MGNQNAKVVITRQTAVFSVTNLVSVRDPAHTNSHQREFVRTSVAGWLSFRRAEMEPAKRRKCNHDFFLPTSISENLCI
jgi:hypothetical protein